MPVGDMWKHLWDRVQSVVDREAGAIKRVQDVGLHGAARIAATVLGEPLPGGRGEIAQWQCEVLRAIQGRVCRAEGMPDPEGLGVWSATQEAIEALPPEAREQLGQLAALIEVGPRFLGPSRQRFTELDAPAQDTYLRGWSQSALPQRRAVFGALKGVCAMGYWSQPAAWEAIGYEQSGEGA